MYKMPEAHSSFVKDYLQYRNYKLRKVAHSVDLCI